MNINSNSNSNYFDLNNYQVLSPTDQFPSDDYCFYGNSNFDGYQNMNSQLSLTDDYQNSQNTELRPIHVEKRKASLETLAPKKKSKKIINLVEKNNNSQPILIDQNSQNMSIQPIYITTLLPKENRKSENLISQGVKKNSLTNQKENEYSASTNKIIKLIKDTNQLVNSAKEIYNQNKESFSKPIKIDFEENSIFFVKEMLEDLIRQNEKKSNAIKALLGEKM